MPAEFGRRETLALTILGIILIVMRQTQVSEVIEITARSVALNMRKLASFRRQISIQAEAQSAAPSRDVKNLRLKLFSGWLSHGRKLYTQMLRTGRRTAKLAGGHHSRVR